MSNFSTFAITAAIVSAFFLYYFGVYLPVKREQSMPPTPTLREMWMDFIYANINRSFTQYHCHQCRKLIILFDNRFRKETPPDVFMAWMENLYNRLDTRYKSIMKVDEGLSNLTSEDIKKIISE